MVTFSPHQPHQFFLISLSQTQVHNEVWGEWWIFGKANLDYTQIRVGIGKDEGVPSVITTTKRFFKWSLIKENTFAIWSFVCFVLAFFAYSVWSNCLSKPNREKAKILCIAFSWLGKRRYDALHCWCQTRDYSALQCNLLWGATFHWPTKSVNIHIYTHCVHSSCDQWS